MLGHIKRSKGQWQSLVNYRLGSLDFKYEAMKIQPLMPRESREFGLLGERIKLARLRRKYSAEQVSERAGISLDALSSVESGDVDVSIGVYFSVLRSLGLGGAIYKIAEDDTLGRKLQDIELLGR